MDPEAYVDLMRVVYPRVKAVDPSTLVLGAGLARTLAPGGDPEGMNDLGTSSGCGCRGGRRHGRHGRPRLWLADAAGRTRRPTA